MRRPLLVVMPFVLAGAGCSLLGLTDVPPQGECSRCEELNLIELPPDCMSWQCGPDNLCVVDLVDQDGDGAPFPRCALDERPADCDDMDALNGPEQAETCDARDNDCDERIDEGLALSRETVFPMDVTGLAWARQEGADQDVLLASALASDGRLLLIEPDNPMSLTPTPVPDPTAGTALARIGEERAVLYTDRECGALRVIRWTDTVSAPSGPLPRAACDPDDPLVSPVLVLDRERRGLALGHAGLREACESSSGGVVSVALITREDADWTPEPTPLDVGMHDGLGPAAMLAVEGLDFVVARVESETLHVARVAVSAADLGLSVTELHSEPCGAGCGHVALAADGAELAVAYRAGDCASGEVRLRRFGVEGQDLQPLAEAEVLASGTPARVALAARSEAPRWAVAWADEDGVRIARAPSETPIGELTLETPGRVEQAMDLAYGDRVSLALFEPNTPELARAEVPCPARP